MTRTSPRPAADPMSVARGLARLDRIDVWALPRVFLVVIGFGTVFVYYDIYDINVSWVESCTDIVAGCTPATAVRWLGLPVMLNLIGYAIGSCLLGPLADRFGRREMAVASMVLTGLGSLYNAVAPDYFHFVLARLVTGIGVGMDIAVVSVYLNELAPRRARAKYTAFTLILAAIGAMVAVWLGLVLTTKAGSWPAGLPFAQGTGEPSGNWRWMYGIGAVLAAVALLMRVRLPESPRWLLSRGRVADAEPIIADMERRAEARGGLRPLPSRVEPPAPEPERGGLRELVTNPVYLRRSIVLTVLWTLAFTTVYSFGSGMTAILTSLEFTPPTAGLVVAMGTLGYLASQIVGFYVVERLERRAWLPIGTVIVVVGSALLLAAGGSFAVASIGGVLIFFGFNLMFAPMYAVTAESYPTRIRSGAFGIVDGLGHIGGGIGVFLIARNVATIGPAVALGIACGCMVLAALVAQLTVRTKNRSLEEVSP